MSWGQWPHAAPQQSTVVSSLINPAPTVIPPGLQYTTEQWTQMQQQNWQQWAQWQQQYQQWHQQYGAEYQKSMTAAITTQPILPTMPNMGVPPPLPVEAKPPLPPEEAPRPAAPMPLGPMPNALLPTPPQSQPIVASYTSLPPNHKVDPNQGGYQSWQNSAQNSRFDGSSNKRPLLPNIDSNNPKRHMVEKPGGSWQAQSLPSVQPQQAQRQGGTRTCPNVTGNVEELSEAEKKFDKQFVEWEAQFNKWKEQNVEHPDKQQYREYEKKWENWRAQLLERREQMRRKRLGLTESSPVPANKPSSQGTQNFNQPPPAQTAASGSLTTPTQSRTPLLATPNTFNKPPPDMNNEPLAFKPPVNIPMMEEEDTGDFLKSSNTDGIPGLDLVKEDTTDEEKLTEKGPDLDAISKGIDNILGDRKLLDMLSRVSKNQSANMEAISKIPGLNDNTSLLPPQDQSNQSYEERSNQGEFYNQRETVHNFDDQTRSSFTMQPPDQEFGRGMNRNLNKGRTDGDGFINDNFGPRQNDFRRDGFGVDSSNRGDLPPLFNRVDNFNNRGPSMRPDLNRGNFVPNMNEAPPPINRGNFGLPDDGKSFNRNSGPTPNQGPDFGRLNVGLRSNEGPDFNRGIDSKQNIRSDFNREHFDGPEISRNNFELGTNDESDFNGGNQRLRSDNRADLNRRNFGTRSNDFSRDNFGPRAKDESSFNRNSIRRNQIEGFKFDEDGFDENVNDYSREDYIPKSGSPDFRNKSGPQSREGPNFNRNSFGSMDYDRPGFNSINSRLNMGDGAAVLKQGGFGQDFANNKTDNFGSKDVQKPFFDETGPPIRDFQRGSTMPKLMEASVKFGRNMDAPRGRNADPYSGDDFGRDKNFDNIGNNRNFNNRDRTFGSGPAFKNRSGEFFEEPDTFEQRGNRQPLLSSQENYGYNRTGRFKDYDEDKDWERNRDYMEGNDWEEEDWNRDEQFPPNEEPPPMLFEPPPPDIIEIEPPVEEVMWKPSTIIDYDHKTMKPVEPEVLLEPIRMFDYRHKPLNRIPFPERPQWLSDAVRLIPEFDPPANRPILDAPSRRYPMNDRFDARRDDRGFDNRRGYDQDYPESRNSYDDRRGHNKDYDDMRGRDKRRDSPLPFSDRKPYEDRGRERDRGDRGDRERDRGDRGGDRERERGDRGSERFERGGDRGDRDRDRTDRDRDRNDRDRVRTDRDRDRSDRGGDRDRRFNDDDLGNNRMYDDSQKRGPISDDRRKGFDRKQDADTGWAKQQDNRKLKDEKQTIVNITQKTYSNITPIEDIISPPGRFKRALRIVIILRGPPGSGKTFLAKLIKDKEVENGGSAPRILSLDDYFMVEQEKDSFEEGKRVKIKEMVYEFEEEMEDSYRMSLMKSFKKTITDGYFSFIIVDNVNDKVKHFGEMWSFAKQNGFQVYICQMDLDVQNCTKRNIHNRTEADIKKCVLGWEATPSHHPILDALSLLQSDTIPEVEMEEIDSPGSDDFGQEEGLEERLSRSKWDNVECSNDNLAKLDGVSKPLRPSRTMEEYLQLDEWTPSKPTRPGQKTVRWADLEERKQQEKIRAIGFVVGQTDWNRMMDPTMGGSALTQTKYIERKGRYAD